MNSGLPVTELNGLEDYMKKNDVFDPMVELFRSQLPNVLMGMLIQTLSTQGCNGFQIGRLAVTAL